jgi:NAD(P)-dependent dehydrogenase (short-subunit alcohol dehydrogenase family)
MLADRIIDRWGHVNALVNAAAVAPAQRQVVDGVERQLAVNALSYHRLTHALRTALLAGAARGGAQILNVASDFAGGLDTQDLQFERRTYSPALAYQQSKQAVRMLSWAWHGRLAAGRGEPAVLVNCIHPGAVAGTTLAHALGLPDKAATHSAPQAATQLAQVLARVAAPKDIETAAISGRYFVRAEDVPCRWRSDTAACEKLALLLDSTFLKNV